MRTRHRIKKALTDGLPRTAALLLVHPLGFWIHARNNPKFLWYLIQGRASFDCKGCGWVQFLKYLLNKNHFGASIAKCIIAVLLGAGVGYSQRYPSIHNELLQMEKVDQDARFKCSNGTSDEQIKCLAEISKAIDEPNTKRITQIFDQIGFPNTGKVGKEGMQAYMTLLQHAPTDELRVRSLKPITEAFKNKEIPPMAYANFVDRLRLHQGKKQIYGSGFEIKDGKLVLSPTKDVNNLEKRRTKIGLPPMAEYIKELEELYHLKAVYP